MFFFYHAAIYLSPLIWLRRRRLHSHHTYNYNVPCYFEYSCNQLILPRTNWGLAIWLIVCRSHINSIFFWQKNIASLWNTLSIIDSNQSKSLWSRNKRSWKVHRPPYAGDWKSAHTQRHPHARKHIHTHSTCSIKSLPSLTKYMCIQVARVLLHMCMRVYNRKYGTTTFY